MLNLNTENVLTIKEERNEKDETKKDKDGLKEDEEERKTSYWEALVHMFRGTVGTGILALPSAFNEAGYIGGMLGILAITYMVNYCALILAKCQQELAKRKNLPSMTYQMTVLAAFEEGPKKARNLAAFFTKATNFLLVFGQIAGNCTYVIFIATNIKEVLDPYIGERSITEYIAWSTPFILATNMVISLKRMALVSLFGNIVLLSSVSVIFYYVSQDIPPIEQRNMFGRIHDIPYFVGTIYFASGCITLVLPMQNDMKKPKQMISRFGVLNMNAMLTGSLYLVFGLMGYLKFGSDATQATVTVNLPKHSLAAKMVQIFLSISTMTATAVQNYITVDLLWEDYLKEKIKQRKSLVLYLLRFAIVIVTVLIAMIVPNLKLLISVIGIFGQCTLASTMPTIIHIFTFYQQRTLWEFFRTFYIDAIVLTFNLLILIFELTNEFINIWNKIK